MSKINFVIAAPWPHRPESLCVYAWGNEVHTGTIELAVNMRDRVRELQAERDAKVSLSSHPKSDTYDIYVLSKYEEEK